MRTRSLLQPRTAAVLALVDPALRGHAESVHDLRVAGRSLRAALRTLARRPQGTPVRKTRRTLQRAIQALADARDRDVGRALILKRGRRDAALDPALKRRILGLSDSDRRLALARAAAGWPRDLDHRLIALLESGEAPLGRVVRRTRAEAWQQRRRALQVVAKLGRRYDPDRLHELRRRVRSLRYAIEVLGEVDLSANDRVIQLKPLQSALGDAQDCVVLSRWLLAQARQFARTDRALSSALQEQASHFRAQARASHTTFLKLRPRSVLEGLALHVEAKRPTGRGDTPRDDSPRVVRAKASGRQSSGRDRPTG